METREFIEILKEIQEYKPVAQLVVRGVKEFGPDVYELMETISNGVVDLRASAIKRYQEEHGFTKEEAMLLVMNTYETLFKNIDIANKRGKKTKE